MSEKLSEKREFLKLKHKLIELSWEAAEMADEIDEYLKAKGMRAECTGSFTVTDESAWKRTIIEIERDKDPQQSDASDATRDLENPWRVISVTPFRETRVLLDRLPLSEEQFQMYVDLVEKEEEVIE